MGSIFKDQPRSFLLAESRLDIVALTVPLFQLDDMGMIESSQEGGFFGKYFL